MAKKVPAKPAQKRAAQPAKPAPGPAPVPPAPAPRPARQRSKAFDGLIFKTPTGGDPQFYPAKTAVEKQLGRKLTTAEFLRDYYEGTDSHLQSGTSIFDPVLCELLVRWFCPPEGCIIDPFAGGSVRGIVSGVLGRTYLGVDLSAAQIAENERQAAYVFRADGQFRNARRPEWVLGDSSRIASVEVMPRGGADFLLSCPPYFDLEQYSDDPADLSNMGFEEFKACYAKIIARFCGMLANHRFAAFVIGDCRDKQGSLRGLPALTIAAFQAAGLALYNEAVLVTPCGTVAVRCMQPFIRSRKLGKTHQSVLIFVKGDPVRAAQAVGAVECGDVDQFAAREDAGAADEMPSALD
jgi:hypothetical protein